MLELHTLVFSVELGALEGDGRLFFQVGPVVPVLGVGYQTRRHAEPAGLPLDTVGAQGVLLDVPVNV